ncbi:MULTISPECIES: DUF47 domain-containing protein [Mammaliicoccus]|uniref:DUF47 domain-containing protein n=1 Tax=Mammaliicoccus fleurettii TaxID=150056 RepID=A0ABS5MLB3_9STAP|nr:MULTISPECIES: DUF47 domain-containing protein [Mammaliicoccus]HCN60362.1 DUF47 domain-containing protein [Staphylococcus sp.]MBL0846306.1 DUF47 domain-containing protein [Mammaliicoccus fleurettii]MBO3061670.1 DUF47 domain-containing protein [Mammaliicoccus fleurettii]MBS3671382.1 DUF47 domain-containing protein [Mammaliicoccus fleurettii]MBS3696664.1 DUF47 domain-containing protein [Mammaliicoccus fleurettii]
MFNKKKDKFGIQLEAIAENLSRASVEFGEMDFDSEFDLKAYSDKIKAYESNGDDLMHQMITDLNQTFITPIEREDILELCDALDDVLDEMEETSAMFEMYSISYSDDYMAEFVKNIQAAIKEIEIAVTLVAEKKFSHIRVHSINIKEYETNCDVILRESIKYIFNSETDPVTLIKIKDIYESLEDVADKCQLVANKLEQIIMKNS